MSWSSWICWVTKRKIEFDGFKVPLGADAPDIPHDGKRYADTQLWQGPRHTHRGHRNAYHAGRGAWYFRLDHRSVVQKFSGLADEQVKEKFVEWDTDHSGALSDREVAEVLCSFGQSERQIKDMRTAIPREQSKASESCVSGHLLILWRNGVR